jgi:hypothetical protein
MPDVPVEKAMGSADWPTLSVPEAVKTLERDWDMNRDWWLCRNTSMSGDCKAQGARVLVSRYELGPARFAFAALPPLKFSDASMGATPAYLVLGPQHAVWTGYGDAGNRSARRMASALLTLKAAWEADFSPAADEAFKGIAETYRQESSKPPLPEDARRFKVQAEAAVQAKNWSKAAFSFREALLIAPWWPEGRFNRALILGEMGDYAVAAQEMQRYLLLVPGAPNARAAQDKIYVWEDRSR